MAENEPAPVDPRWGQQNRDRKAEAILATLQLHCARDLTCGTWLDIGCGSGGVAATLAAHVQHVIGVDPESWERWKQFRAQHSNLDFHAASYRDLETLLGPESADVVVCNQVYEHVDDPMALFAAIYRVMRPGAVCYFAGPNLLWPIEPHVLWPFVHWLPRSFALRGMRALGSKRAHDLDAWSWSFGRLTKSFRRTGFRFDVAIHQRVVGGTSLDGAGWILHAAARLPPAMVNAMAAISPGFVFVLSKTTTAN